MPSPTLKPRKLNFSLGGTTLESIFELVNSTGDDSAQYSPILPSMNENTYKNIFRSVPQLPYIVSSWQSNVGSNDSSVKLDIPDDNNSNTRRRKELIQQRVYDYFYKTQNWKKVEQEVIAMLAREGNAILMFNSENQVIVESKYKFDIKYDGLNHIALYDYKVDGEVIMANLKQGKEVYHIKDPIYAGFSLAPSRLDAAFATILMENKGLRANINLFAGGFIGNTIFSFDKEMYPRLQNEVPDKQGKTFSRRLMDKIQDTIGGLGKAFRGNYIAGLNNVFELGKNNRDSQFMELLTQLTPERLAWAYSMTMPDFGTGGSVTYNNAGTFDDALYDKVGRPLEDVLDRVRNDWVLPQLGRFSTSLYISYNKPEDPNKLKEVDSWRQDWMNNAITLNEYRDFRELPPLPDGDTVMSKFLQSINPAVDVQSTQDQNLQQDQQQNQDQTQQDKKKVQNALMEVFAVKNTPTEQALNSEEYTGSTKKKGFLQRWDKAINKQIDTFLESFSKLDKIENYKVTLPKIETFYAFNVLKNDLLKFADRSIEAFNKDKRIENKIPFAYDEAFGRYPQSVIDFIDQRVEALLKGNDLFDSVDIETSSEIETIIRENISRPVSVIASMIEEAAPEISKHRAELIASTEVANAVEGTQYNLYNDAGFTKKAWQTCHDERVRPAHIDNESEGTIPINEAFQNGNMRAGQDPRCRCTTIYYP